MQVKVTSGVKFKGRFVSVGETIDISEDLLEQYRDYVEGIESEEEFICEICGFEAKSKQGLSLHMRVHDKQLAQ
jgi:hypothetical protein